MRYSASYSVYVDVNEATQTKLMKGVNLWFPVFKVLLLSRSTFDHPQTLFLATSLLVYEPSH